jgi:hypothetical protein
MSPSSLAGYDKRTPLIKGNVVSHVTSVYVALLWPLTRQENETRAGPRGRSAWMLEEAKNRREAFGTTEPVAAGQEPKPTGLSYQLGPKTEVR